MMTGSTNGSAGSSNIPSLGLQGTTDLATAPIAAMTPDAILAYCEAQFN
jgi:hypothetical protein